MMSRITAERFVRHLERWLRADAAACRVSRADMANRSRKRPRPPPGHGLVSSRIDVRHPPRYPAGLCDLHSVTKGQQAIRAMTGAMMDRTGDGRAEGFVRCAAEALA
jgi:hypothetical protein